MVALTKNILLEKIRGAGALTDADLYKNMAKDDIVIPEDRFNKILLDLEIMGLIKVAWVTKDGRRIEAVAIEEEESESEYEQNSDLPSDNDTGQDTAGSGAAAAGGDADMSYEASFPGLEK